MARKYYTKIDALDDTIDMYAYGSRMWHYNTQNTYVPVRHNILPKPDFKDKYGDDLYRYNNVPNGVREPIQHNLAA